MANEERIDRRSRESAVNSAVGSLLSWVAGKDSVKHVPRRRRHGRASVLGDRKGRQEGRARVVTAPFRGTLPVATNPSTVVATGLRRAPSRRRPVACRKEASDALVCARYRVVRSAPLHSWVISGDIALDVIAALLGRTKPRTPNGARNGRRGSADAKQELSDADLPITRIMPR
jgi:hypothetical protein